MEIYISRAAAEQGQRNEVNYGAPDATSAVDRPSWRASNAALAPLPFGESGMDVPEGRVRIAKALEGNLPQAPFSGTADD